MKTKSGNKRKKAELHLKALQMAKAMAEKNVVACEMCGTTEKKLQLHHLYAVSQFPDKELEPNNTMLVCSYCHTTIHNNPFLWLELIKERMPMEKKVESIMAQPPYQASTDLLNFQF